ncbi:hypothetical protein AAVH_00136 [Aphelenchoides avenae]|nr:hypothetical protein AAVH_00136 [Aphelenchus avenae]
MILRMHDGDVGKTIDELLQMTDDEAGPSRQVQQPASRKPEQVQLPKEEPRPSTVDDEKIALMIQNREFLEYLRSDPRFMRELGHDEPHHNYGYRPIPSSYSAYNPGRRTRTTSWTTSTMTPAPSYYDHTDYSVPDGPVIEYNDVSSSSWKSKLKSKLPKKANSLQDPPYEAFAPHTMPVDYYNPDPNFADKLRNMSKTSKEMFVGLAKKFSASKRDPHLTPMPYEGRTDGKLDYEYR